MKLLTYLSSVLSQFTRLTDRRTDRQTDRRTAFLSLYRVCIPCSTVKTTVEVNYAFGWFCYDLDSWSLILKTTHVTITSAKFLWNLSAKWTDIASRGWC